MDLNDLLLGAEGDQLSHLQVPSGPGGNFIGYNHGKNVQLSHEERLQMLKANWQRQTGNLVSWNFTTAIPAKGIASGWGTVSTDERHVDAEIIEDGGYPQTTVVDSHDGHHSDNFGNEGVNMSAWRGCYGSRLSGDWSSGALSAYGGLGVSSEIEEEAVPAFSCSVGVDNDYVRTASLEDLQGYVRGGFSAV